MTQRLSTILLWSALIGLTIGAGGCSSILGALLAPESVATSAATNLTTSAVTATDMTQVAATSQTVNDLNQILRDHPDAANSGELESLRQSLLQPQDPSAPIALQGGSPHEFYDHGFDRRTAGDNPRSQVIVASGGGPGAQLVGTKKQSRGDVITLEQPPAYTDKPLDRRAERKPFHAPRTSSLDTWQPYLYRRTIQSIRLDGQVGNFMRR